MADRSGWSPRTKALRSSLNFRRPEAVRLDPLDNDGRRHAACGAHRHQAALEVAPFQLVEHGTDQDRAGGADGVAERDRAAVDVDLVTVELEVANEFLGDDGEGLVDLEQV